MQIEASEVVEVLRAALRGCVEVKLIGDEAWTDTGFGNFEYVFGGWRITFFNDAMELDYVDSAIAPDGRSVEYSEWFVGVGCIGADPIELLGASEVAQLEALIEKVRPD